MLGGWRILQPAFLRQCWPPEELCSSDRMYFKNSNRDALGVIGGTCPYYLSHSLSSDPLPESQGTWLGPMGLWDCHFQVEETLNLVGFSLSDSRAGPDHRMWFRSLLLSLTPCRVQLSAPTPSLRHLTLSTLATKAMG